MKDNPWDVTQLEVMLFSILSVTFELVAIFLMYLSQLGSSVNINNLQHSEHNNKIDYFRPKVVESSVKSNVSNSIDTLPKKIGFQPPGENSDRGLINQDDLQKYLDYMYSNAKDNISPGYIAIGQQAGIGVENARKIKAYLERNGIIEVQRNRTIILSEFKPTA